MSSNAATSETSSDELWSVAFSNVGRAYGDPKNQKEIARAIQAISGPSPSGLGTTNDAAQSQLCVDPPTAEQQGGSEQQYNFVFCTLPSTQHDAAGQGNITIGTDVVGADTASYPTKPHGIPGRRGHLVPGSSRPWRVKQP